LLTTAGKQHRLVAHMSTDHPSVGDVIEGNALGKIRPLGF
jgi:hypothetical protein